MIDARSENRAASNARPGAVPGREDVALRCAGLRKRYGKLAVVDGLDLEIRAGECLGLVGRNGAGKTTTLEIFAGLIQPDGGDLEILGHRCGSRGQQLLERLGVQLQDTQLSDRLTVTEVIRLFRSFYRRGRGVGELIETLGLGPKRNSQVQHLSGGQRQRLAIACALAGDPDLLLLDEPTTGLDLHARLHLWDVVAGFCARGGTALLTTHSMEEAARLCNRIGVMEGGKIVALASPAELVKAHAGDGPGRQATLEDVFIHLTGKAEP